MYAVRNIRLCTKDCMCLYVCPTGATNTETGQIDHSKCTACRACIEACPSHAISMVPDSYPAQQPKVPAVKASMAELAASKCQQEAIAFQLAQTTGDPILQQLANILEQSNRLMAEDAMREAGYMLPQSSCTRLFLQSLLERTPPDEAFPLQVVRRLLKLIEPNELC